MITKAESCPLLAGCCRCPSTRRWKSFKRRKVRTREQGLKGRWGASPDRDPYFVDPRPILLQLRCHTCRPCGSANGLSLTDITLAQSNTSGLDASCSTHAVQPAAAGADPTRSTSSGLDGTGPGGGAAGAIASAGAASSKRSTLPINSNSLRCSFAAEAAPVGAFHRRNTGTSSQFSTHGKAAAQVPRGSNSNSSNGPSSASQGPAGGSAKGGASCAAQQQAAGKLGVSDQADEAIARGAAYVAATLQ